jgi:hypothetical protein
MKVKGSLSPKTLVESHVQETMEEKRPRTVAAKFV